jgi:hypothetical protein
MKRKKNRYWFFPIIAIGVCILIATNCKKDDKIDPVITWEDPADITYGTMLSEKQLNATTNVPGIFLYAPALGTILKAGAKQDLRVDFTPTDIETYNKASKKVNINVKVPDNIVYQYYGEENFISSIISSYISVYTRETIPTPYDSTTNLSLDVDKDSNYDFIITAWHKVDNCGRSNLLTKIISINGINADDSIRAFYGGGGSAGPNPEKLDSTIDISKNGKWMDKAYFLVSWPCYGASSSPYLFDDMLIGIKKGNKFGWLHVKPKGENGICLLESAINLSDNNSIFAGQKY